MVTREQSSSEDRSVEEMLSKWDDFCSNDDSPFDDSDFTYFFAENPSEEQIARFLRPFPHATDLLDRITSFMSANPDDSASVSDEQLVAIAREHVSELERQAVLLGEDDLAETIRGIRDDIVVVDEIDDDARIDSLDEELGAYIADAVIAELDQGPATAGLIEALYGISNNYYVTWYLAAPLIDADLDMSAFHRLWLLGGDCAVTTDQVLVERFTA